MAKDNNQTPEKELLRLIEKPLSQQSLQAAAVKYHSLRLFSLGALKGRLAFLKDRLRINFKDKEIWALNLKIVNSALELCIGILAAYLIFNVWVSTGNLKKGLRPGVIIDKVTGNVSSPIVSLLKTASYYLEKARERDIFKLGPKKTAAQDDANAKEVSPRLIEATQHLKLVGIAWSDDPDVMIEDTRAKMTFFLKKGQMVDDRVRLQAVFRDKVILSYQGEEIELK